MSHWRSRGLALLTLVAATTTASEQTQVSAATPPPVTVAIRRNTTLNQRVLPGDMNGDGIVDLVASDTTTGGNPGYLMVSLGNGDGTFRAPFKSNFAGVVLAVADFSGDGKLDVVGATYETNRSGGVYMMAGKGDGTLGSPQLLSNTLDVNFALAADFDGDKKLDLFVVTQGFSAKYFSGRGDLTFLGPYDVTTKGGLLGGTVADYDNDGRPDIIVASHDEYAVTLYHNQSTPGQVATFGITDMPLDRAANDVALADLNHDGNLDLVIATSSGEPGFSAIDGYAYVLMGHGSDAFGLPVKYQLPPLAWQVEIGDFNRDGILDIATANRSPLAFDDCGPLPKTWDTVSILPGNGDGTFAAPSSFSLGDQSKLSDFRYRESVISLATADVNGDGKPDLVASWGAIVINNGLDPNWPPHVGLGPDQTFNGSAELTLQAVASDSDNDMLTYSWSTNDGETLLPIPNPCVVLSAGVHTFTVTVNDQHGHTASDTMTITVKGQVPPNVSITAPKANDVIPAGQPYTIKFTVTPTDAPIEHSDVTFFSRSAATVLTICANLPPGATQCVWNNPNPPVADGSISVFGYDTDGDQGTATVSPITIGSGSGGGQAIGDGWVHADIGSVGAAGNATSDGTALGGEAFTVSASGADIWGTSDEFHYVWKSFTGDFQTITHVDSLQSAAAWTKAGLMMRVTATDASSPHASIIVSGSQGVAFQRRLTERGSSLSTQGPIVAAPVWLRLVRKGSTLLSYYRKNTTDAWTLLGQQSFSGLPSTVNVGLAVTSHADGSLATAKFSGVRLGPLPTFTGTAIGAATGGASTDGTTYTIRGSGADIWGTSDAFFYFALPIGANEQITARVRSLVNVDQWSKAGVMIRESLAANAKQADAIVSPSKGIAFQYRASTSGATANAALASGAAPIWLRVRRFESSSGGTSNVAAWWSSDGITWHAFAASAPVATAHSAYIGLAVTSHHAGVETTAIVDDVWIEP